MTPEALESRILEFVRRDGAVIVADIEFRDAFAYGPLRWEYHAQGLARRNGLSCELDPKMRRVHFRLKPLEIPMPPAFRDHALQGMLDQCLAGELPPPIFADWLEERGDPRHEAVRGLKVDWQALGVPFGPYSEYRQIAERNVSCTLAWLFRPLLDSHDKDTALWLFSHDLGSVEELAPAGPLGAEGPAVYRWSDINHFDWRTGEGVPPRRPSAAASFHPAGRVHRLWAIDGRLYGELRFWPDVDARPPRGCSVEVMQRTEKRGPYLRAVMLRAEEAPRPPRDTGQLFSSLGGER